MQPAQPTDELVLAVLILHVLSENDSVGTACDLTCFAVSDTQPENTLCVSLAHLVATLTVTFAANRVVQPPHARFHAWTVTSVAPASNGAGRSVFEHFGPEHPALAPHASPFRVRPSIAASTAAASRSQRAAHVRSTRAT